MQLLPPQSIDPNVPAQIPADQLQDFKGFLDVVLDTVVGGAAPDVLTLGHQLWGGLAAIVVAWSGLKIAYSGTLRTLGARACRARDRDSEDAAPLLQRPDPGRRLHVPGHGRGRRNLAPEPVHLRCRVRRLHGDDRAGAGVRRTARRGMVRWEPDDRRDRGRERVLLVPRRADDGRAARARPGRALLPDLRAGDLGAGGARDRDPAWAPCSSPGCCSSRSRSCSGDGSARSWSTRSTAS